MVLVYFKGILSHLSTIDQQYKMTIILEVCKQNAMLRDTPLGYQDYNISSWKYVKYTGKRCVMVHNSPQKMEGNSKNPQTHTYVILGEIKNQIFTNLMSFKSKI